MTVSLSTPHQFYPLCFFLFLHSRPINISQRANPTTLTVTTRRVMAHQTPHLLTRYSDALMKVLSADMEMALDTARQKPPTQCEEKTVSWH